MNKIYKLVWSKVRNTWVAVSEMAKAHGKSPSPVREKKLLKSVVLLAMLGCFTPVGMADVSAALPIGTNSMAEGEGAIATGRNSVAIGTGAVATGDNLTGDKIKSILKENEEELKHIEDLKRQVQQSELDFQKKYDIYVRVEEAKKKIEANNKLLAETLRPALEAANQNYNAFKPGYDNAVNEMNQRLSLISNLDFTLIAKDPANGLDTLAQDLKEKSEEGYDFSNDISFYKTYIQSYIKAKGDLAHDKKIYVDSGVDSVDPNTLANPSEYEISQGFMLGVGGDFKSVGVDKEDKRLEADSKYGYYLKNGWCSFSDSTEFILKEDLDDWTVKKAKLSQKGLEVINGQKSIFVDETTKQGLKDKLQAYLDYADYIFHAKYEQKCYQDAKDEGNEAEALTHLQKKIEYEDKAKKLQGEWFGENGKNKKVLNHYKETVSAWKKAHIDDIENSNTLAIDTLKKQYLATLETQKKKLNELQRAIDQAAAAIEAKERENKQLQPTPKEIEEAKKAEAAKQKLEAEKQALKEALEKLKLNDLTDVGTNALAYGTNALVTGKNAIGIGTDELVTGEDSIGIGRKNTVSGTQSVAIGTENTISGSNSGAVGTNNSVLSDNSFAIGKNNSINKEASGNFILGNDVVIANQVTNSVIVGNGSSLSAPAKVGDVTPYGVISVGAAGKERQIQNVAPGRIAASSTDAVNGGQLNALAAAPMNFYFGGRKENNVYTPGTTNWTMPLNDFRMDFGSGLKAEQVEKDGKTYTLVTLDKDSLKGDPAFKGDKGENGKDGINGTNGKDGTNGKSAYDIWKETPGNEDKSEKDFMDSLKGDKGEKGENGKDGINGTNGKSAYDIWKETPGNEDKSEKDFMDSLKGEKGDKGENGKDGTNGTNGKSAYDIWKEKPGNEDKSEKDFMDSLKGEKGDKGEKGENGKDGTNGKSAYDIWKETPGNEDKSEKDFMDSLKGDKGEKGENGKDGINGTGGAVVEAGDNIIVNKKDPAKSVVSLKKDISIDSVKVGNISIHKDKGIDAGGKKITGVAAGDISRDSTDAVNGSQIFAMNQQVLNNTAQIGEIRDESREGDAMGAAMAALKPLDYDPYQRSQIMAGVGHYSGKEAFALGVAYYKSEDLMLHGGLAYGGSSDVIVNAGVSYRFGNSNAKRDRDQRMPQYAEGPISSVYILQNEVERLKQENEEAREEIRNADRRAEEIRREANEKIAALEAKLEEVLQKVK